MAPKHHVPPLSGSDRKALTKELAKSRAVTRIFAERSAEKQADNKCACCPNKATQVHHRCYRPRVLSGEDTSLLIALCATCHKTVDFDERGKVREAHAKERILAEMFDRESKRLALTIAHGQVI